MQRHHCGSQNPDDAPYCAVCKRPLPVVNPYNPNQVILPPVRGDKNKNWAAVVGFILSLLCFATCSINLWIALLGPVIVIASLVISIIGTKSQNRGLAIAGIVISSTAILLYVTVFFVVVVFGERINAFPNFFDFDTAVVLGSLINLL